MNFIENPKFWVAVATITFVAIVLKPAKKAILEALDGRIAKIKKDLEEANRLKTEALELYNQTLKRVEESENEAKKIIENAKSEAENVIRNTNLKLQKDIEARKQVALSKIKSIEENAIEEVKKNIAGMVLLATHTIIEENLDDDAKYNLEQGSLEKIEKTYH